VPIPAGMSHVPGVGARARARAVCQLKPEACRFQEVQEGLNLPCTPRLALLPRRPQVPEDSASCKPGESLRGCTLVLGWVCIQGGLGPSFL
jgi:hypothetical protein